MHWNTDNGDNIYIIGQRIDSFTSEDGKSDYPYRNNKMGTLLYSIHKV